MIVGYFSCQLKISNNLNSSFISLNEVNGGENYMLPSCFFSSQQLCTLELQGCVLEPPPTFTGFTNLKSLYLSECTLGNGVLERLISKCPLLGSMDTGFIRRS